MRARRTLMVVLGCVVGLQLACADGADQEAAAKAEIEAMLSTYLPVLAEAYAEGDPRRLIEWVAEKEVARVGLRLAELEDQGRRLAPEFHDVTVEEVKIWGHSNAFVVTLETWTLRSLALGTDQLIQEVPEQASRVRYQLKKDDGRWRVLFRTVAD